MRVRACAAAQDDVGAVGLQAFKGGCCGVGCDEEEVCAALRTECGEVCCVFFAEHAQVASGLCWSRYRDECFFVFVDDGRDVGEWWGTIAGAGVPG